MVKFLKVNLVPPSLISVVFRAVRKLIGENTMKMEQ